MMAFILISWYLHTSVGIYLSLSAFVYLCWYLYIISLGIYIYLLVLSAVGIYISLLMFIYRLVLIYTIGIYVSLSVFTKLPQAFIYHHYHQYGRYWYIRMARVPHMRNTNMHGENPAKTERLAVESN